jgi:hypothetical protein
VQAADAVPASGASGPPAPTDAAPTAAAKASAQEHFTRAKELYASGKYPDAIAELQHARSLDPSAKDLVFNLGVVSEKLAKYDDALKYYRLYITMVDVTEVEKARAESYIKRVDGAKRALPPPTSSGSATPPPPPPPEQKPEKKPHGRIDAATISAAAIGVAGLGVGTVFGVKALSDTPPSNTTTSKQAPYSSLQSKQDTAHKEAFISDIGFAVGGAGVLAAAVLFLAREKDKPVALPKKEVGRAASIHLTNASVGPTGNGAGFVLGGEF